MYTFKSLKNDNEFHSKLLKTIDIDNIYAYASVMKLILQQPDLDEYCKEFIGGTYNQIMENEKVLKEWKQTDEYKKIKEKFESNELI